LLSGGMARTGLRERLPLDTIGGFTETE
jgi:hypothetical protein